MFDVWVVGECGSSVRERSGMGFVVSVSGGAGEIAIPRVLLLLQSKVDGNLLLFLAKCGIL